MTICLGIVYFVLAIPIHDIRHIIIACLGLFWSIRLSFYLLKRIRRSEQEDTRYQSMRKGMGPYASAGFFVFYQVQSVFVTIFTTPIAIALLSDSKKIDGTDVIGCLIFIIAVMGEALADRQLMKFKEATQNKKKTCSVGLWFYSRHPNYFFEWLHWFSYPLFSLQSDYLWISCLAPIVMLLFLLKLTGIPHVEREALKNKTDYKGYMETTSVFIPWFKKKRRCH